MRKILSSVLGLTMFFQVGVSPLVFADGAVCAEENTEIADNIERNKISKQDNGQSIGGIVRKIVYGAAGALGLYGVYCYFSPSHKTQAFRSMLENYDRIVRCQKGTKDLKKSTIPFKYLKNIFAQAAPHLLKGSHVQEVKGPAMIVGDIHGDYDAARFWVGKFLDNLDSGKCESIVFLGDYVDRGKNSVEIVALLLQLKSMFPDRVYLLRGNHETPDVNISYGLLKECDEKYNQETTEKVFCGPFCIFGDNNVYKAFNEIFDCLPLTAVVDNSAFCVHGGIPHSALGSCAGRLDQIRSIPRKGELNDATTCTRTQLLWNDFKSRVRFAGDNGRCPGAMCFGEDVVEEFLRNNGLKMVVRAHEHEMAVDGDGMKRDLNDKLLTLIGKPDYLISYDDRHNNAKSPIISGGNIIDVETLACEHMPVS